MGDRLMKALNRNVRGWGLVKVVASDVYCRALVYVRDGDEVYPVLRSELRDPVVLSNRIKAKLGLRPRKG
jgi:hypothetical protein